MGIEHVATYAKLQSHIDQAAQAVKTELIRLKSEGALVLGYGASTKGNVLLQYAGIGPDLLSHIAEVNPDKFGCETPGTHIPIISEEDARDLDPTHYLVLPWHFREGILEREKAFIDAGGEMIFPLPKLETVKREAAA